MLAYPPPPPIDGIRTSHERGPSPREFVPDLRASPSTRWVIDSGAWLLPRPALREFGTASLDLRVGHTRSVLSNDLKVTKALR